MALITWGDIVETWHKVQSRGWPYLMAKLNISPSERVKATWNASAANRTANWWTVPTIREQWNERITGYKNVPYEQLVALHYASKWPEARVLSIGCGSGSHEIRLAQLPGITSVLGIDLSENTIAEANRNAQEQGVENATFKAMDLADIDTDHQYNIVLFHNSLHHFENLEELLQEKIPQWLAPGGILVLFEFIGATRFQWPERQLKAANDLLRSLPKEYRRRIGSGKVKNTIYRPGIWRMIVNDPSESIRSAEILPLVHQHYETEKEVRLGGTLMQLVLQDIAHHFANDEPETQKWLQHCIDKEDAFEQEIDHSDFIFGIYQIQS